MRRALTLSLGSGCYGSGEATQPESKAETVTPSTLPGEATATALQPPSTGGENRVAGLVATACSATTSMGGGERGPGDPILGLEESEIPRRFACRNTGTLRPMKMGKEES